MGEIVIIVQRTQGLAINRNICLYIRKHKIKTNNATVRSWSNTNHFFKLLLKVPITYAQIISKIFNRTATMGLIYPLDSRINKI